MLIVGTADTKSDELLYLAGRVALAGGTARTMDVGVLGTAPFGPDIPNHEVAAAAEPAVQSHPVLAGLRRINVESLDLAGGHAARTRRASIRPANSAATDASTDSSE